MAAAAFCFGLRVLRGIHIVGLVAQRLMQALAAMVVTVGRDQAAAVGVVARQVAVVVMAVKGSSQ